MLMIQCQFVDVVVKNHWFLLGSHVFFFLGGFLWKCVVDLLIAFPVDVKFVHVCAHACSCVPSSENSQWHVQRLIE